MSSFVGCKGTTGVTGSLKASLCMLTLNPNPQSKTQASARPGYSLQRRRLDRQSARQRHRACFFPAALAEKGVCVAKGTSVGRYGDDGESNGKEHGA